MAKLGRSALLVAALLCSLVTLTRAYQTPVAAPSPGVWHLLAADEAEQPLPQHRVDFRLQPSPAPFKAVMVNRVTGEDIPLASATFDGRTLRLQMRVDRGQSQADAGWLQMTWNGTRFDGGYIDKNGAPVAGAVALKLVKGKD